MDEPDHRLALDLEAMGGPLVGEEVVVDRLIDGRLGHKALKVWRAFWRVMNSTTRKIVDDKNRQTPVGFRHRRVVHQFPKDPCPPAQAAKSLPRHQRKKVDRRIARPFRAARQRRLERGRRRTTRRPAFHRRFRGDRRRADPRLQGGRRTTPTSSILCALLFLRPLIRALLGDPDAGADPSEPARLAVALPANGLRRDYMRATLVRDAGGLDLATPIANQDSSLIKAFARADALLARAPNAPAAAAGEMCRIIRLAPLGA